MERLKHKLLLRSSGRQTNANDNYDLNANSKGLRGPTLTGGQVMEESGPWGLKELCPGRDPIVEYVQALDFCTIRKRGRDESNHLKA